MLELLVALNRYANRMLMGEAYCPIVFRLVKPDDVLINDRFADGQFASGNHFALTDNDEIVYAREEISDNLNCIYLWFSERSFNKAMNVYKQVKNN